MTATYVYREHDRVGQALGVSFGWNELISSYFLEVYDWYDSTNYKIQLGSDIRRFEEVNLFLEVATKELEQIGVSHEEFEKRVREMARADHH
jgi:hypothetical protein